jgi:DhnA family fructose-bisphosphate aldolase class Ia
MATILWCYLHNPAFKADKDYHVSADLTGQANHLGVALQADIIKQKLPENNGGYSALKFGKTSPLVYEKLTTDHPIDLCRYQVAKAGLREQIVIWNRKYGIRVEVSLDGIKLALRRRPRGV